MPLILENQMLSDQELGRVHELIAERDRYVARIKGYSSTHDADTRARVLHVLYDNLRKVETELSEIGVIVTPYQAVKETS